MYAIEINTTAKMGNIYIPEQYRKVVDGNLKLIVLKEEKELKSQKAEIREVLNSLKCKKVFPEITDSVQWQKDLRNEWE